MNCPKCQSKYRVLNTSSADTGSRKFIRASLNPLLDWYTEEFVARQRACHNCGHNSITLEIDKKDFIAILKEVLEDIPEALKAHLEKPKPK